MNRVIASLLLFCATFLVALRPVSAITVDTVFVGNAGNANDPRDGDMVSAGVQNCGAVPYEYRIGTYEVTNDQYVAFLNEKAKSDPLSLYSANMDSDARGGITRSGSDGIYNYAVKPNMGNKPVNYVSWYDAIRFTNWLHNGQGSGDTETGAYSVGALEADGTPIGAFNITRNVDAKWFLPTDNEWYKAAYHQPFAQGGPTNNYWLFPTALAVAPTVATANVVGDISNPGNAVANYNSGADWNNLDGNLTTVGSAGPQSKSFYGTFDQGGNVYEWNETRITNGRFFRGGAALSTATFLMASARSSADGTGQTSSRGFRVATVPEPSTSTLAAMAGLIGLTMAVRRQRDRVTSH